MIIRSLIRIFIIKFFLIMRFFFVPCSCFPSHSPEIEFENYVPANLRSDPQDALIPWQEHQIKPLADLRHDLDIGSVKHWSFGYGKDPVSTVDFERYSGSSMGYLVSRCLMCCSWFSLLIKGWEALKLCFH